MKNIVKLRHHFFIAALLVYFFGNHSLSAQERFVPGYILLNSGDTLRGLINDLEWKVNPKTVEFKKSSAEKPEKYTPLQIRSFRIRGGNWYFSFAGMRDHSSWETSQLNYNALPDTSLDTLFLRALMVGKASLFTSFDETQRRHFYLQKDGGAITELYDKKYLRTVENGNPTTGQDAVQSNEIYKGQLVKAFSDCSKIASRFASIPLTYEEMNLENIFREYNACFSNHPVYAEKKEKWVFEPTLIAGINYSNLVMHLNMQKSSSSSSDLGYAAGFALNCRLPRNHHSFSCYAELLLKNYNGEAHFAVYDPTETFVYNDTVGVKFTYLRLNTFLRYQIMNTKAKPLFEFGISNSVALQHEVAIQNYNPRTYEQGVVGGVGVSVNHFSLEARYEFSNGFGYNVNSKSSFGTFYGLLSYSF